VALPRLGTSLSIRVDSVLDITHPPRAAPNDECDVLGGRGGDHERVEDLVKAEPSGHAGSRSNVDHSIEHILKCMHGLGAPDAFMALTMLGQSPDAGRVLEPESHRPPRVEADHHR
jgi:hypothetical protein